MSSNIKMVNLQDQYLKIKFEIDEAIQEVMTSAKFINGPQVKNFAKQLAAFNEVSNVVTCGNGTDALQLAMMALGFKPGDEVIVPVFTYVATAEVIAMLGLKPIFVDVNPKTFNIDVNEIEKRITERTVAVVPVNLYGQCANLEPLLNLAKKYGLKIIEDNAQAIGAEYYFADGTSKKSGTVGDAGTFSFFPSKNLGCFGDGGAVIFKDEETTGLCQSIANHGQKVKYYHERVGINSRLDTLQAAILEVKLKYLENYIFKRQQVAAYYDTVLDEVENIEIPYRDPQSTHVFHQYTIKVKNGERDELKAFLQEKGIPSMIYYPLPLHKQEAYKQDEFKGEGHFPIAEELCKEVLSLPIHTEMKESELEYITESVKSYFVKQRVVS